MVWGACIHNVSFVKINVAGENYATYLQKSWCHKVATQMSCYLSRDATIKLSPILTEGSATTKFLTGLFAYYSVYFLHVSNLDFIAF